MDYERNIDLGRSLDGGQVFASVRLSYSPNGSKPKGIAELGISFEYTPKGRRRHGPSTSYGQTSDFQFEKGTLGYKIKFIWEGYHLNIMNAGCEHQRAAKWTYEEHPCESCPVCGYKMGTKWRIRLLPKDVEKEILKLVEPT